MDNHTDILTQISQLRTHPHILDKKNIEITHKAIGGKVKSSVFFEGANNQINIGDDTAAIKQPDGSYLLFAAEGIVTSFLENDPWFAGYSAVMVNISDITSMGGLPIAVTDTIYAKDAASTGPIWEGMLAASKNYGVPIVGGHTCFHNTNKALSVSILGKSTQHLLTSFDAQPGDELLVITDIKRGNYFKQYPFWNASTTATPKLLQQLTKLPYQIANNQWSKCAKDISMGGILGTLLMLMNTSKIGVKLHLNSLTKPTSVSWEKWLVSFPSYGYIMTCKKEHVAPITNLFESYEVQCDHVGKIVSEQELIISHNTEILKF